MNDLWTLSPRYGELWAGDELVCRFNPADSSDRGLYITANGVEGWDTLPDAKVELHERGQGDGAHDVPETDILYSARTVTVHYEAVGYSRADLLSLMRRINTAAHRSCRLRMVDGDEDTYCEGYVAQMGRNSRWNPLLENDLTLHFVCPRPERLSWDARRFQLVPAWDAGLGLSYGSGDAGLAYPLSYGRSAVAARNVCTLVNNGSSRAYPVFTVQGPWPDGVQLTFPGLDMSLDYSQAVGGVPLVLDSRSRTASIGGLDVSRNLRQRGFPTVPPGGSVAVNLQSVGDGHVTVECRDTYM